MGAAIDAEALRVVVFCNKNVGRVCLQSVFVPTPTNYTWACVCLLFYCDRLIPDVNVRYVIACVRYSSIICYYTTTAVVGRTAF